MMLLDVFLKLLNFQTEIVKLSQQIYYNWIEFDLVSRESDRIQNV